ncbi:MAG: hypothetical protein AAFZ65_12520, partial [Planctomycetota bacterium]
MEGLPHAAVALGTFATGGLYFLFVRARLWRSRALETERRWRHELDRMRAELERLEDAGAPDSADRVDELEGLVGTLRDQLGDAREALENHEPVVETELEE